MEHSVAAWPATERLFAAQEALQARLLATSLFLLVGMLILIVLTLAARWLRRVTRARPPAEPSKYVPADDWYQKPLVPPVVPPPPPDQDASP